MWTWTLFHTEWLALEHDMLHGDHLVKKLLLPQRVITEEVEAPTTSAATTSADAKLLRACCQNAVTICVMVLQGRKNRRLLAIMTHVPAPVEEAFWKSAVECKDVESNSKWLLDMLKGR